MNISNHTKYILSGSIIIAMLVIGLTFFNVSYSDDDDDDDDATVVQDYQAVANLRTDSPLMTAILNNDTRAINHLLSNRNFDVDYQNDAGFSALHYAVYHKKENVVKRLLELDADPNLLDVAGESSLQAAVDVNAIECVRLLLDAGADRYVENNQGRTPIDYAHNDEMRQLLAGR